MKIPKKYYLLLAVCYLVYTGSIFAKMIYSASMVAIIEDLGISKTEASLALTCYYLLYFAWQIVAAIFMKRLPLDRIFTFSMIGTAVVSCLLPTASSVTEICILWGVNALFHSAIYGGCLLLISRYMPQRYSGAVSVFLGSGLPAGTALAYALSSLCVNVATWRVTFYVTGGLLFLIAAVWFFGISRAQVTLVRQPDPAPRQGANKSSFAEVASLFALLMCLTFLSCTVYYALTNWFPSLLYEVFGVPKEYSILIGVLLPIVSFIGTTGAERADRRHPNSFFLCTVCLLICLPISLLMAFFYSVNMLLSVALSMAVIVLVRGVMTLTTSLVPLHFGKIVNAGSAGALINGIGAIGAALAPLLAAFALSSGWSAYYLTLGSFTLLSLPLCLLGTRLWRRKITPMLAAVVEEQSEVPTAH